MRLYKLIMVTGFSMIAVLGLSGCKGKTKEQPDTPEAAAPAAEEQKEELKSLATVNGREISRAEFDDMYNKMTLSYQRRNQEIPEDTANKFKANIVSRLIDKELLKIEMEKQGITLSDEELNKAFDDHKAMFKTDANFERYLEASNSTEEQIKDNLKYQGSLDKLLNKDGVLAVSKDEVKEYYEKNKDQHYKERDRIKIQQIVIRVAQNAEDVEKQEALAKATKGHEAVNAAGADFAAIAKEYSDYSTTPLEDDEGFIRPGRLPAEVDVAVKNLKVGEITAPVVSPLGYHVVKLVDRQAGGIKDFAEVKDSIERLLLSRQKQLKQGEILREIRVTADIVNNFAAK